ncbi:MAG: FHA domain-containing protein [Candidatus Thermoplasmatota archaeon]|jgi:hypothetical protein|nr:FHA domain-containing protein [Candidatus Thermoplasmatota archaeon]
MPARKRKYVAELPDATVMDIDGHLVIGRETLQDHVEHVLDLKYISREQLILDVVGQKCFASEHENSKNGLWLIRAGKVKKINTGEKIELEKGDEISLSKYFSVLIREK